MKNTHITTPLVLLLCLCGLPALAQEDAPPASPLTAAILPFQERGADAKGEGTLAMDLLFAELVVSPDLMLVDRTDIDSVLKEMELSKSGMVNPSEAIAVGRLTGAKVIITGSVIAAGKSKYLVAKLIGTETSRVLGESVKDLAGAEMSDLVEKLAPKILLQLEKKSDQLVAKIETREDRIAGLVKKLGDGTRPSLYISIPERHVGQATIDPAAETELGIFAVKAGFTLFDKPFGADVIIRGEAFSETAIRRGDLISVKGRVEIKAVGAKSDEVLAIDRQASVAVDLVEQIAGKAALQEAAAQIAIRLLPDLVEAKVAADANDK